MKRLTLILFLVLGLGVGVVYAGSFAKETVFYSDAGGGNITFAEDCTFSTMSIGDNQRRFTDLEMNGNGSWTSLGFRNPDPNCTLEIVALGTRYIQINCTVDPGGTTFEVWLPDDGEPDTISGDNGNSWSSPTLDLTKTANGTITLEWDAPAASTGGGGGSLLLIIILIFVSVVLVDIMRRKR